MFYFEATTVRIGSAEIGIGITCIGSWKWIIQVAPRMSYAVSTFGRSELADLGIFDLAQQDPR